MTGDQTAQARTEQHIPEPRRRLRSRAAAEYCGVSEFTMRKLRMKPGGPIFMRVTGTRIIVYDTADLDAWMENNLRASASGEVPA